MKKENNLVISNDYSYVKNILNFNSDVVVMTDNLNIHEMIQNYYPNKIVTYISKAISYKEVEKSVIEIIKNQNKFYDEIYDKSNILHNFRSRGFHVEGGLNQFVQDTLLLIESITKDIDSFKITKIYSNEQKYSSIIKTIAKSRNLEYKIGYGARINRANFFEAKIVMFYFKLIYNKLFSKKRSITNVDVLLEIFSPYPKHTHPIKDIINDEKAATLKIYSMIWGFSAKKINIKEKEKFFQAESFLTLSKVFKSVQVLLSQTSKLLKYNLQYKKINNLEFKNIKLNSYFRRNTIAFIFTDIIPRYTFDIAFKEIIKQLNPKCVQICCEETRTTGFVIAKYNFANNVIKFNFTTMAFENKITQYAKANLSFNKDFLDSNFYLLVQNELEREIKLQCGYENVLIYNKECQKNTIQREDVKKDSNTIKIVLDFPSMLFGYHSFEEISQTFMAILDVLECNDDLYLMIKPHPGANVSDISKLMKHVNHDIRNKIQILPKIYDLVKLFKDTDILITKDSTIGYDALEYDNLVISCLFDNNSNLEIYGKAANYFYDFTKFRVFLKSITVDHNQLDKIKSKLKPEVDNFLSMYKYKNNKTKSVALILHQILNKGDK